MITPRLRWQIGAAIVGTLGFILAYSQPWREPERLGTILLYDLAAAPLVFAFIGAYLYDLYTGERRASWRLRWALLIPTGGIPSLRALGWLAVSGHLSTTLIVGFYPAANAWRHPFLRAVALLPALVCYLIRVLWGQGLSGDTWSALLIGSMGGLAAWTWRQRIA